MARDSIDLDPFDTIFDPSIVAKSKLFLLLITHWASLGTRSDDRISRIKVKKVIRNKLARTPEHEFLVFETYDTVLDRKRDFILDRTMATSEPDPEPIADSDPAYSNKATQKFKKFAATLFILFSSSARSESLRTAGSSSQVSPTPQAITVRDRLTSSDKVSLPPTESADFISDSLGVSEDFPALDQFMGEVEVKSSRWQGEIRRSMVPIDLTLFDLVILAHVAHELYPTFSYSGGQYFYAELILGAIETHWGVCPSDSDETCQGLSDKSDMKVNFVDMHWDIAKLLNSFKAVRLNVLDQVYLFRLTKILPLTTAFGTGHGNIDYSSGPDQMAKS